MAFADLLNFVGIPTFGYSDKKTFITFNTGAIVERHSSRGWSIVECSPDHNWMVPSMLGLPKAKKSTSQTCLVMMDWNADGSS